jgi:hypothetical protein
MEIAKELILHSQSPGVPLKGFRRFTALACLGASVHSTPSLALKFLIHFKVAKSYPFLPAVTHMPSDHSGWNQNELSP